MKTIEEQTEGDLTMSEYGSEIDRYEFSGNKGAAVRRSFGARVSLNQKRSEFGAVNPNSIRPKTDGAVPLSLEIDNSERSNVIAPGASPSVREKLTASIVEYFRPSIFDMQRSSSGSTMGNYSATSYDKTSRMSIRGSRPGLKGHETEDSVLGDLLVCLLGQK
jgi:hypothetical protein